VSTPEEKKIRAIIVDDEELARAILRDPARILCCAVAFPRDLHPCPDSVRGRWGAGVSRVEHERLGALQADGRYHRKRRADRQGKRQRQKHGPTGRGENQEADRRRDGGGVPDRCFPPRPAWAKRAGLSIVDCDLRRQNVSVIGGGQSCGESCVFHYGTIAGVAGRQGHCQPPNTDDR